MHDLDELLKIDASVAQDSALVFMELPPSIDCANAGLMLFDRANAWMDRYSSEHPAHKRFDEAVVELSMSGTALFEAIRAPAAREDSDALQKARGASRDVSQIIGYRTLLQLAYRAYRSGLTDLRRLRLTAAAGHLRLEAESAALIILFLKEPVFCERWLNPAEDMKRFFSDSQPKVKAYLKDYGLIVAYDHGSAVAQHSRFASAARGLRLDGYQLTILDQEFDPTDPVTFLLGLGYFLRMQVRMFEMITASFTALAADAGFSEAFDRYRKLEDNTWWVLERKYAAEISEFHLG